MNKLLNMFLIPLVTAIFTIIYGIMYSALTGFVSRNEHLIYVLLIWAINISISYIITVSIFKIFNSYVKFWNKQTIILSGLASVCLVVVISGSLECLYLTTVLTGFAIFEVFEKIKTKRGQKD